MASDLEEHFLARPSTSKVGTELTKVGTELTNMWMYIKYDISAQPVFVPMCKSSKCSDGSCDMKKAFISIVISRLPVQLGGCQRILRCARDRLEPLSLSSHSS